MKCLKTLMIMVLLLTAVFLVGASVQAAEVNNDDELAAALRDAETDTITINYRTANISEFIEIDRNLTINGNGAVLTAKNGTYITMGKGTSLVLKDIVITGQNDFAIKSYGRVELTGTVEFAGGYGLLMNNGSTVASSGVLVSRTGNKIAVAANPNGGEITVSNVVIDDTTTDGTLLYIYRGGGTVYFSGNCAFRSSYGSAIYAPIGSRAEQKIVLTPYSSVTAHAGEASDSGGYAAAFNVRECALELQNSSRIEAKGSCGAIYCDTLKSDAECIITAENTEKSSVSGAITVFGKISQEPSVSFGEKNTLTVRGYNGILVYGCKSTFIGSKSIIDSVIRSGDAICSKGGAVVIADGAVLNCTSNDGGIRAKESIECGTDCEITISPLDSALRYGISCEGGIILGGYSVIKCRSAEKALYADESVVLEEYATLDIENIGIGIETMRGVQTGKGCMINIKKAKKHGVYAAGTLLADIVSFGEENTINITSDGTALYSAEAIIFNSKCNSAIECGNDAPALYVDTLLTTQGYLRITDSTVNVISRLGSDSGNAAVNIVGSIIIEENGRLNIESSGSFGILCRAGDLIVGTDSMICSQGGCAVFVENGNIRLSQGGSLFAKGTLDSGIRVSNGMLRIGEGSTIITEGERFGAEILDQGGIWLENPELFDFRSTKSNALYMENGVFSAVNTKTVSAWYKAAGKKNMETWWNADVSDYKAWEINSSLADENKGYADYTQHSVNATAYFENGTVASSEGFEANIGAFNAGAATRISSFKTRPISSPNYLFIPSGRAFSWKLEATSVEGEGERFHLVESPVSGTASLSENGILSYSASAGTRGEQTLKYTVTGLDGAQSMPVEVVINVTKSKPPAAYNHTFDVQANGSLMDRVTATDFDGVIASLTITEEPEHGTISLGSDGTLRYTPEGSYTGFDSFSYIATDNNNDHSNEAVVTLLVGIRGETTARNNTYVAAKNEETTGSFSVAVPRDDSFGLIKITTFPHYGTLEVDGSDFVYTPPENFAGTETFGYTAITANGAESNEAFISIITVPSEKPKADTLKIDCASGKAYSGKLSAKDLDGKISTYMIDVYPQHGTLDFDASGGKFTYTAHDDYIGTDSFSFYVYDDEGLKSEIASVGISVDTYLNMLKASGQFEKIILGAVIAFAVIATLAVIIITGTVRKRKKQDREYEKQYLQNFYDDYFRE